MQRSKSFYKKNFTIPNSLSLSKQNPTKDRDVTDSRKETEEILNEILPPRSWEEDGQLWIQTVLTCALKNSL